MLVTPRNVLEVPTVARLAALIDTLKWTKRTADRRQITLGDDEEIGTL